jgi:hypothetical protein
MVTKDCHQNKTIWRKLGMEGRVCVLVCGSIEKGKFGTQFLYLHALSIYKLTESINRDSK